MSQIMISTLRFLFGFKVLMSLPSYFVVYVGIAVNGYIAPVHGHPFLAELLFLFGFNSLP